MDFKTDVKIKRLHPDAVIPVYATTGSAGFDLVCTQDTIILPGGTTVIPTGLSVQLPESRELQVRDRSGICRKTKLRISNSPGTVDSDYTGEIGVLVDNLNPLVWVSSDQVLNIQNKWEVIEGTDIPCGSYVIRKGDRIAQGVIAIVEQVSFIEVDNLAETERGDQGFGSTGTNTYV